MGGDSPPPPAAWQAWVTGQCSGDAGCGRVCFSSFFSPLSSFLSFFPLPGVPFLLHHSPNVHGSGQCCHRAHTWGQQVSREQAGPPRGPAAAFYSEAPPPSPPPLGRGLPQLPPCRNGVAPPTHPRGPPVPFGASPGIGCHATDRDGEPGRGRCGSLQVTPPLRVAFCALI